MIKLWPLPNSASRLIGVLWCLGNSLLLSAQPVMNHDLKVLNGTAKASEASPGQTKQVIKYLDTEPAVLTADYYPGDKLGAGVLLMHDCNTDRHSYHALAELLAANGIHALAIDLRGYGDSSSDSFSQKNIRSQAKDIVSYQGNMMLLQSHWDKDIQLAYGFLRAKVDKSRSIAAVSCGCSASYAAALAEKIQLNSIVYVSPLMSFIEKEHYKNITDIPSYFITSEHNIDSYATAKELFEWNGATASKMQILKGSRQGQVLTGGYSSTMQEVAIWLQLTLR